MTKEFVVRLHSIGDDGKDPYNKQYTLSFASLHNPSYNSTTIKSYQELSTLNGCLSEEYGCIKGDFPSLQLQNDTNMQLYFNSICSQSDDLTLYVLLLMLFDNDRKHDSTLLNSMYRCIANRMNVLTLMVSTERNKRCNLEDRLVELNERVVELERNASLVSFNSTSIPAVTSSISTVIASTTSSGGSTVVCKNADAGVVATIETTVVEKTVSKRPGMTRKLSPASVVPLDILESIKQNGHLSVLGSDDSDNDSDGLPHVSSVAASGSNRSSSSKDECINVTAVSAATVDIDLEAHVEEFIRMMMPKTADILHRSTIQSIIDSHDIKTFQSELSIHNCFLPDDPLKLAVIVWQDNLINWSSVVAEKLASSTAATTTANTKSHYIVQITSPKNCNDSKVNLIVDALPVELTPVCTADLCMSLLTEHIAILVGNNNLFRRSVLLIRSWWLYECSSYIGCSLVNYLSDNALIVLVLSLFNRYHATLTQPIQVLGKFLEEYSVIDWSTDIISLEGILSVEDGQSDTPRLPIRPHFLVQAELLSQVEAEYHALKFDSDVDVTAFANPMDVRSTDTNPGIVPTSSSFKKMFCATVIHPISYANMVSCRLSPKRVKQLRKVLHMGHCIMQIILNENLVKSSNTIASYNRFFRASYARFYDSVSHDTNHDMATYASTTTSSTTATIPTSIANVTSADIIANIQKYIHFCKLSASKISSETSFKQLAIEVLKDGPLPVGEIGKVLQEKTKIENLSNKIKERFGGLKKFLERYPDCFIVSTNHPFNPHVFLRSTLTREELNAISRGISTAQISLMNKSLSSSSHVNSTLTSSIGTAITTAVASSSTISSGINRTASKKPRNKSIPSVASITYPTASSAIPISSIAANTANSNIIASTNDIIVDNKYPNNYGDFNLWTSTSSASHMDTLFGPTNTSASASSQSKLYFSILSPNAEFSNWDSSPLSATTGGITTGIPGTIAAKNYLSTPISYQSSDSDKINNVGRKLPFRSY